MTDAPYRAEGVPAPPGPLAELERLAAGNTGTAGRAAAGALLGIGFVVAVVFGIIGLVDLAFAVIGPEHWLVLVLGSAILVLPMLLVQLRQARRDAPLRAALADRLRAEAAAGRVLRHDLRRDERHWFVEHEHGVIHVCPADGARTLYLDLSSVSDDARHDAWYAKGLIDRSRWTWFTTTDGAVALGFEATGDALPPRSLEAEAGSYDPEAGGDLFEFLGSPGDGDLVERPWAAVDAFIRARIAAKRAG